MTVSSSNERKENRESKPKHRLRLPGLLSDDDIGLGDVVEKTTYALGIQPMLQLQAYANTRWVGYIHRAAV